MQDVSPLHIDIRHHAILLPRVTFLEFQAHMVVRKKHRELHPVVEPAAVIGLRLPRRHIAVGPFRPVSVSRLSRECRNGIAVIFPVIVLHRTGIPIQILRFPREVSVRCPRHIQKEPGIPV